MCDSYDEKTDVYSLGMLLFEMCHPPFGTKMERTVVLTNAHRLVFSEGSVWGPPKGQDAMKALCGSMLQEDAATRPSASDIVRQVCKRCTIHEMRCRPDVSLVESCAVEAFHWSRVAVYVFSLVERASHDKV